MATTWYVSNNTGANGFSAGSDSNAGTSKGAPFLTIDKACKSVVAGDTVNVNSGGVSYSENSGSGYLNVPTACTIQTDATALTNNGHAKMTDTSAAQTVNFAVASITWIAIDIDNASNAGYGINLASAATSATIQQTTFFNISGGAPCVRQPNSVLTNVTLDRCIGSSANGVSATVATATTTPGPARPGCRASSCTSTGFARPPAARRRPTRPPS